MHSITKKRTRTIGASLLIGVAIAAGSATAGYAVVASGTTGQGTVHIPTSSPYISIASTTTCIPDNSGRVLIARARTVLAGVTNYGADSIAGIGPNSVSYSRKSGTYRDAQWNCDAKVRAQ